MIPSKASAAAKPTILAFMSIPELSLSWSVRSLQQLEFTRRVLRQSMRTTQLAYLLHSLQEDRIVAHRFNKSDLLIPLKEAANYLPKRRGKKPHYSTLYRWATKGSRGRILESTMIGGIRYTSIEAIESFIAAPSIRKVADIDNVFDAIDAALDEAGL